MLTALLRSTETSTAPPTREITTEVLSGGLDILDRVQHEWRALCEESRYDEPFHRPELVRAYLETFVPDGRVVVVAVRKAGRLIAILPLVRELGWFAGLPARKLRAAGNVHTCRYDLVHARGVESLAVAATWTALKQAGGWDMLDFRDVPAHGALTHLVRLARSEGFACHANRAATSPYLALPDDERSFQQTLERTDAKFRANLRRRMRKLEAKGAVRLARATSVDGQLTRFYELERGGWKGDVRSAIVQDGRTRRFYEKLAAEAERYGYLSLYSLECAGESVAMQYGLTHKGRYFVLKTAYDEALRECSPGQLITLEVLRDLTRKRCGELDFLGVSMDWKRDWAPRLRPHADWYVFRGALGALLHVLGARARRILGRRLRTWKARAASDSADLRRRDE